MNNVYFESLSLPCSSDSMFTEVLEVNMESISLQKRKLNE